MKGDGIWTMVGLTALALYLDYRRKRSTVGAYDPKRPGEGTNIDPSDPGYAVRPTGQTTAVRPTYIPLRPAPMIPGGLPAAQIVDVPAYPPGPPSAQTQALSARLAAKRDEERKLYESARAMEAIKAAFAAQGKVPPGATSVPAPSQASRDYAEAIQRRAKELPSPTAEPGMVKGAVAWTKGTLRTYGGPTAAEETKLNFGLGILNELVGPDEASRIMQAAFPAETEMAAGSGMRNAMRSAGFDSQTIRRFEGLLERAGTVAEKAFEGAVAMGLITQEDVSDASLNRYGRGALKIANILENSVSPAVTPSVTEMLTEARVRKESGGRFSEEQIREIAKGTRDDVKKAIDEIAASDRNFAGRRDYLKSVAEESAVRHMRPVMEEQTKTETMSRLQGALKGKAPDSVIESISSAVAQDVGNAFYQGGKRSESELTRVGSESVLRNLLPHIPSVGQQYASDALELLGFILPPEKRAEASKLIGQDMASALAQRLSTGSIDIENINSDLMSSAVASAARRVGPMLAEEVKDVTVGTFTKAYDVLKEQVTPMLQFGGGVAAAMMVQENKESLIENMERALSPLSYLGEGVPRQLSERAVGDAVGIMGRQLQTDGRVDLESLKGEVFWNTAMRAGGIWWDNVKTNVKDLKENIVHAAVKSNAMAVEDSNSKAKLTEEQGEYVASMVAPIAIKGDKKEAEQTAAKIIADLLSQNALKIRLGDILSKEERKAVGGSVGEAVRGALAAGLSREKAEEAGVQAGENSTLEILKRKALDNQLTVSQIKRLNDEFFPKDKKAEPLVGDDHTLASIRLVSKLKPKLDEETRKIQYEDEGWAPYTVDGETKYKKLDLRKPGVLEKWQRERADELVAAYQKKMEPKLQEEARRVDEFIASRSPIVQEAREMITEGILMKAPQIRMTPTGTENENFKAFVDKYGYKGELTTDSYQRLVRDYANRMESAFGTGGMPGEGSPMGFVIRDIVVPNIDLLWPVFAQAADPSLDQRERYDRLKKFAGALDALTVEAANRTIPKYLAQQGDEAVMRMMNQQVAGGINHYRAVKAGVALGQPPRIPGGLPAAQVVDVPALPSWEVATEAGRMQGIDSIDDIAAMEFGRGRW